MRMLKRIGRELYGHDRRAINLHSERTYEDADGTRFVLSRTLDGCPPFFEAFGPFARNHEGLLPRLRVRGRDYWGDGWSWPRAERVFCVEIRGRIVGTEDGQSQG